jgi:hypothetical protein
MTVGTCANIAAPTTSPIIFPIVILDTDFFSTPTINHLRDTWVPFQSRVNRAHVSWPLLQRKFRQSKQSGLIYAPEFVAERRNRT